VEADGQSLVYLPDHQAPPDRRTVDTGVLELCEGADLVIHDAQYTDDEFMTMSDWGHSTVAYAVHVAAEAGAKRLALFHHDPSHADRDVDRQLSRARSLASARGLRDVTAAAERTTVDLAR
jgi:ribonuclease BN (tRNA processing enzyme)